MNFVLVEDDDVDAECLARALRRDGLDLSLHRARDGVEALALLRDLQRPDGRRRCVVLLDLNIPKKNGLEVLDELRRDGCLRGSIVFVLTTSDRETDKRAAYDRQVAGYLVKSELGDDFRGLVELLRFYAQWVR